MQYLSFPFDWLYGADPLSRADMLCEEFKGMLAQEDLEFVQNIPAFNKDLYRNTRNHLCFNHDFLAGVPLSEGIGAVHAKYKRRGERLVSLVQGANRVLLVWISTPATPKASAEYWRTTVDSCVEKLKRRFGREKTFDFFIMERDESIPFRKRTFEPIGVHASRVMFDYKDKSPGAQPYSVVIKDVAAVLRGMFEVGDYRTADEKTRHERAVRASESEERIRKYGADGGIRMVWGRLMYKIRRHCDKHHRAKA